MKILVFLVLPIWVFSSPLFSSPLDVPQPPVANPVLSTDKDHFFKDSTDLIAHSPEVPEVQVVHHQDLNKKILIALVVASSLLGGILLLLSCFSIYRLKRLKKCSTKSDRNSDAAKGISLGPILDKFPSLKLGNNRGSVDAFEYQLLVVATNNFEEENVLGEGESGRLYKAHFNEHFHAAVKKIFANGQEADREFENEIQSLSKIHHQNIVSLLGYCRHGEAQFLIYEMMENGSLEFHLHGPFGKSELTWPVRMKIALDVARGLEYLHEHCDPPVIHRDIKSSNILLDSNFNAKMSNFGLAVTGGGSNQMNIKLSGTLGYVAPEYLLDGKLTDKSDVYSFGVVLLELLLGQRPVERVDEARCQSIVTWATPQLIDRSKLPNIIDPAIRNTMDLKHLYQVAAIAVLCVQPEPSYRPLITDVLHSFIPLVPVELGGSLRLTDSSLSTRSELAS
ncbi:Serine/threonine protein kinase [Handroanthus impetiginosus]|uniref:Serine/threonine protein kinase n=1 Tax=Handroanthus impetiginosus TaxID=429701 RepID=A0A2G9HMC2_9LAMI|nr:Serine/threonine protein kinase [Handroanthus impetiginosus]